MIAQLIIDIAYSILDPKDQDQIVGEEKQTWKKEVRNTFDPNEEISMEKFQIIGLDEEPEVLARPRVSYWKDAWRRLKSNKIALVALIILLLLTFMVILDRRSADMRLRRLIQMRSIRLRVESIGLVQILSEEIFCQSLAGRPCIVADRYYRSSDLERGWMYLWGNRGILRRNRR